MVEGFWVNTAGNLEAFHSLIMKLSLLLWSSLAAIGLALPAEQPDRTLQKRAQVTVTAPAPDATYVGLQIAQVDQFQAIPYVQ